MIRDLLGNRTTNELLEECALLFHRAKKFMWKDLRPWSEFFAVFNLPQGNSRQIEQRVSTNLIHYKKKSMRIGDAVINEHGKLIICSVVSLILLVITRTLDITAKDDHLSEQLKMNGFNWINGPGQSSATTAAKGTSKRGDMDPENPPIHEEPLFSTANPMNNSAAVRKRASNNNVSVPSGTNNMAVKPGGSGNSSQKKE
eukprot:gene22465-30722_t